MGHKLLAGPVREKILAQPSGLGHGPANNDQSLCYEGVVRPSDSGTNAVATQGITVVIVFIFTVNND